MALQAPSLDDGPLAPPAGGMHAAAAPPADPAGTAAGPAAAVATAAAAADANADPALPDAATAARNAARAALRRRLLEARAAFAAGPAAGPAETALAARLREVVQTLEPDCLGVYWPVRSEFSAGGDWRTVTGPMPSLALPHARRLPHEMHYRRWDGRAPRTVDDCGLPAADGPPVVPDVVLVPCVGYTRSGWRLGYGGGYFDRWLEAHPHVVAVGVAWSVGEIDGDDIFAPEPHDHRLTMTVTEHGVFG